MSHESSRPRWGHRLRRSLAVAAAAAMLATGLPALLEAPTAQAQPEPAVTGSEVFPGNDGQPHEVTWDANSFMVDGERLNIWSGEIHYWRLPSPEHWRDLFQKIRASGFNAVSLYFFWGYHQSQSGGEFDFTGVKDIDLLMDMAAEEGLYIIARPGPYVNAEISMGGLPAYLSNRGPALRSSAPENLADSLDWIEAFNEIALEHEVTTGKGSIIMYQIENEMLDERPQYVEFMNDLVAKVRGDGITVPLFHNDYNLGGRYVPGSGSAGGQVDLDFYAYDSYPLGFNCSAGRNRIGDTETAYRAISPNFPQFISEAQGGAFSPWGASFGFDRCAEFTDPAFTRQWGVNNIGNGVTAFNYYMAFGGTNWGWTGSPSSGYTSYDYGAAINEDRQLTPKLSVQKEIGYFIDAVPQLTSMVPVRPGPGIDLAGGAAVNGYERVATEDLETSVTGNGTRYLGFRLNDSNNTTETTFTTELTLGAGDADPATETIVLNNDDDVITYTGDGWTYDTGNSWNIGNIDDDETWSKVTGDSVELTFTGSAIRVISPMANNHGFGDVYLDGELVGETNTCIASQSYENEHQAVAFEADGLDPREEHTIRIVVRGEDGCPEGNTEPGPTVAIDAFEIVPPLYTVDDTQTDLVTFVGDWETAGAEQAWARGNYLDTETFSNTAGDFVEYTFTGTGIQVIAPQSTNHGYADVYIDGELVDRYTTYSGGQNASKQHVPFETRGLEEGEHTIRIEVTGEQPETSPDSFVSIDAFNVLTGTEAEAPAEPGDAVSFERIPQQEGTYLQLHGRDALMLVADIRLGDHDLYYTTSQLVKDMPSAEGRLVVLSGVAGDDGETVLRYDSEPVVTTVAGEDAATVWDAESGTLRLNYEHGEAGYIVSGGGTAEPLLVKVTTRDAMDEVWTLGGARGEGNDDVLVDGVHLLRTVAYDGDTVHLTGSMTEAGEIAVHVPAGITSVTWNGSELTAAGTDDLGAITGTVPGPQPVDTPELGEWRVAGENPEAAVDFDDSDWLVADSTSADNPRQGPGPNQGVVLDSNHYHFFEGDVWYRAHYTASDASTLVLNGNGGTGGPGHGRNSASMLVWVNGQYAGAAMAEGQNKTFQIPPGATTPGEDAVVSVLVRNQGQNLDWSDDGLSKQNRGLWDARLNSAGEVTWLIQGARDVDDPVDSARTLYNNGGLYGERAGWHLPGYPDGAWDTTTDLVADEPGVAWYRTSFELDVPEGQDTSFALDIDSELFDDGRQDYSRTVMFVNGWNVGTYVGYVGPQTRFTIPSGFLDMNGENDVAIAVTAERAGMGPQSVDLVQVGNMTGGVPNVQNDAPGMPEVLLDATLTGELEPGGAVTLSVGHDLPALLGDAVTDVVVDWGDGSDEEVLEGPGTTAEHTYAEAGTYDVTVQVRDTVGGAVLAETSLVAAVGVEEPTGEPTEEPTEEPTGDPTEEPTGEPTEEPTEEPTGEPTEEPTGEPTEEPTDQPTGEPTEEPTGEPTDQPTGEPTEEPTGEPTDQPTVEPTDEPSPTAPGGDGVGGDGTDGDGDGLPSTGAPVAAATALTALLLLLGTVLVTRRRATRS